MNQVFLIGNIGADAETIGKKTTFSLATSKSWKDRNSGDKKEKTTWHNIVIWEASPKFVQYLKKGKQIAVQGEIDNYSYEKDGEKKYGSAIIPNFRDGIKFLGGNSGGSGSRSEQQGSEPTPTPPVEDEIPF